MTAPLLEIENLRVAFDTESGKAVAVDGLSFAVAPGECLAVVGESGSGKSVTALSVLGLLGAGGRVESGRMRFNRRDGQKVDLAAASQRMLREIRGDEIAMVFQEPMTSLNPVFTVGEQIAEVIRTHRAVSSAKAAAEALDLIGRVRIQEPERRFGQFPHELSGGMRQRVAIAMALACRPKLLIADEPTTALDVTVQAQILDLLRAYSRENGMAMLFITHDMGVVAEIADRVVVMRHGKKVEENEVKDLFASPQADYTRLLLDAVPRLGSLSGRDGPRPAAGPQPGISPSIRPRREAVLEVRGLVTRFPVRKGVLRRHVANVHAVEQVSFSIGKGETLSLVGESGCGKSTTGRSVLRLVRPDSGTVRLNGADVLRMDRTTLRGTRRDMQIVFQDPYASLNPRLTAFEQVAEPLVIHAVAHGSALQDRVAGLVRRVGLSPDLLGRYPHEFSGGQRQRLCIARALTLSPQLIVADEAVSALDVSIQAQVVDLLIELQGEFGLSYLFISHDMGVVERISHRVAVMHAGQIVEIGSRPAVFGNPRHPYTRALLAAVPNIDAPRRHGQSSLATPPRAAPIHPLGHAVPEPIYEKVASEEDHLVLSCQSPLR